MKIRLYSIISISVISVSSALGQCLNLDFTIPTNSCTDESIEVTNTSIDGIEYSWDFCPEDLDVTSRVTDLLSVPGASGVLDSKLIFDGTDWYNIMVSRNNSKLFRASFGSDLDNIPVIDEITITDNSSGAFTTLWGIDVIQNDDSNWVGVVTNANGSKLNLIEFGNSLANDVVVSEITKPAAATISTPVDVDLIKEGSNYYAFISNVSTNKLTKIEFGTSISTNPTVGEDIPITSPSSNFYGFTILKYCDNYYGFGVSDNNDDITRFDFGTSVNNTPSKTTLVLIPISGAILNQALGLESFYHNGEFHLFSGSIGSKKLFHINLGSDITAGTGDLFEDSDYATENIQYSVDMVAKESGFIGFATSSSGMLKKIVFEQDCSANINYSTSSTTETISFSSAGTYPIQLKGVDATGKTEIKIKSITVSSFIAPDIDFSSTNVCVTSAIDFQSINVSGDIISYLWGFGDTNTSPDPNPSHTFATSGDYEISLTVQSSDGCNNSVSKTITIYDPPVPDFTLPSGTVCTNEDYTFTNNTIDNFDGNLTYEWQVGGVTVGTDPELTHQFTTQGPKEIKLITSIPGCDIVQIQNIANVNLGAVPLYSYDTNNACLEDPITFTNRSTGTGITSYLWNFDGTNTSSDSDPRHAYTSAGTYIVSLEVTNAAGCLTNYQDEVIVHSMPVTDFISELACTDRNTELTDNTTVDDANISSWGWDFGDASSGSDNVSSEEHPFHIFSTTGDFNVSLSTTSNFGCETNIEKTVSVLESPMVDFAVENKCLGDAFVFTNTSTSNSGGSISSYTWDINSSIYTVQDPSHTFNDSGTYTASLTVRSNNNCVIAETKMITANSLPTVDFTISSNCTSPEIIFNDVSFIENDQTVDWQWSVNGQNAGNTASISHAFDKTNTQEIELRIITERGCIVSTSKNIDFFELPIADFNATPEYGAVPSEISFENISENATTYKWDFGDGTDIVTELSPTHSYTSLGIYNVKLLATSTEGCTDEITKQVHLVNPEVDLSIDKITTFNNGSSLLFTMSNKGTIPVSNLTATVTFDNEFSIEESFDINILPDEQPFAKALSFSIPDNTKIEFLCIDLSTSDGIDINPDDNLRCINISNDFVILSPYPSPVSRQELCTLPIIGAQNDEVTIEFMDINGKQFMSEDILLSQSGLNNVNFSLSSLKPGIYFIQVRSVKSTESFRIFVN